MTLLGNQAAGQPNTDAGSAAGATDATPPTTPPAEGNAAAPAAGGEADAHLSAQGPFAGDPAPSTAETPPTSPPAEGETPAAAEPATTPPETPPEEPPAEEPPPASEEGDAVKYEYTVEEGFTLADPVKQEFEKLLRDNKVDKAGAQPLIDMYTKLQKDRIATEKANENAKIAKWIDGTKTSPLVGGHNFDANVSVAHSAVKSFGGPAVNDKGENALEVALNETQLGNHPAVVEAFFRVGKLISEDSFRTSAPAGSVETAESKQAAHVKAQGKFASDA